MSNKQSKNVYKSNIVGKVIYMAVVSILVLTTVFVVVYINYKAEYDRINKESSTGKTIVALNEVNQLLEGVEASQSYQDISLVQTKLDTVIDTLRSKDTVTAENNMSFIIIMYVVSRIKYKRAVNKSTVNDNLLNQTV